MIKLGFIGVGRVGTALALKLAAAGYAVKALSSRTGDSARRLAREIKGSAAMDNQGVADSADLAFIATPDDAIAQVTAEVRWRGGQGVVHLSGADSAAILDPAREAGAVVGCFHPLQSFADKAQAIENITGSTFALEAEGELLETLKVVACALEGNWIRLKAADKVLYHAAAVMVCNYQVTLLNMAADLWGGFGVSREDAVRALLPLLKGTVENISAVGLPQCLTGPVARGDAGTVAKHLSALAQDAPHLLAAYRELGLRTIPIALERGGIDQRRAEKLEKMLQGSVTSTSGRAK